ncbi:MAG: DUF4276 family protein [Sedimentisphaerales bacterium]|nr:DUF4276 family protein [Sedimentisphaerales bacterium]
MKFVLLVEGTTEKNSIAAFLKRWLDKQLPYSVGVSADKLDGFGEFQRKAAKKAQMYLQGPKSQDTIGVIGILDLFGPNFYPSDVNTMNERYQWMVEYFEKQVGHPKFRMFMAVHEYEAWLFSRRDILPREVADQLQSEQRPPEKINFDKPPAKRLTEAYFKALNRHYKKPVDGKLLFDKLDPEIAVQKCPYLQSMLNAMLDMARQAGVS